MSRPVPSLLPLLVGGAALATWPAASTAQQVEERTTARIISSLEYNDNFDLSEDSPGDALIWTNTLGGGFLSLTPTDRIDFDAQGSLRYADLPVVGTELELDDPRVVASFLREVDDTRLSFGAGYRRVDVDFFDPLVALDEEGNFDDTRGGGTRESLDSNFNLGLNTDGPVSLLVDAGARIVNYTDTDDEDLNDTERYSTSAEVGFLLNPLLRATVGAGYQYRFTDDEDQTERQTYRVDTGFDAQINPRLSSRVRIGYSEVDIDEDGDDRSETGIVGSLGVTVDMQNGSARANLSSSLTENGNVNQATVGRQLQFRNGSFNGEIGVANSDIFNNEPIGSLTYIYTLPRGAFNAGIRRRAAVDDDANDVINTNVNVGYNQTLTRLTSLGATILAGRTTNEDDETDDTDRVTFTTQFNRTLAPNWTANLGYRHRFVDSDDDGEARSNAVFLTVRRDFGSIR